MNHIFRDLINEGKVVVYIDDLLIFTKITEEHQHVLQWVLELMQRHKLYLKPEKCKFHMTQVEFLWLIVLENCVGMDPIKVDGVLKRLVPKKKKDVQFFPGFTKFYCQFIKDYAKISILLHNLIGKKEWEWCNSWQEPFKKLKQVLTSALVLHMPTDEGKYHVEADRSDFATAAVLSQKQEGKWFLCICINP